jgi:PEP-CTERM motif
MESPPFILGRKHMKFGPVFVLCAAFLITAFPIRADSVPYTGAANDSPKTEVSTTTIRDSITEPTIRPTASVSLGSLSAEVPVSGLEIAYLALPDESRSSALSSALLTSVLRPSAPPIDGRLSDPTPAIASIGGTQQPGGSAAWNPEPSSIIGTFFPPSGERSVHSGTAIELGSGDPASSVFASEGARHKIGRDHSRGSDGNAENQNGAPTVLVPEPTAFSLLLFGLAAMCIFARRRNLFSTTA